MSVYGTGHPSGSVYGGAILQRPVIGLHLADVMQIRGVEVCGFGFPTIYKCIESRRSTQK